MRVTKLLSAAVLAASAFVPQAAAAPPPSPHSCTAALEGALVPANPGNLTATAALAVAAGEVVCVRDVLNSTPNETLSTYGGHITIGIRTAAGDVLCSRGSLDEKSVGPLLVMAITVECFVPVEDTRRTDPMRAELHWATLPPYDCCDALFVDLKPLPVGAAVQ